MSIAGILPEPPALPPTLPPPCRGALSTCPVADGAQPHTLLLLPSAQCMLQLYDPMSDSARGAMQTTTRNVVSRTVLEQGSDHDHRCVFVIIFTIVVCVFCGVSTLWSIVLLHLCNV